jgi:hypothetical protein
VWPGVIPGLPPVVSYPIAADRPPVPGEPAEAIRLRAAMAQTVIDGGWAPSEPARQALRTVPRHRFAPEAAPSAAYDGGDRAMVTRRAEVGAAISSVSAAWLQADMIGRGPVGFIRPARAPGGWSAIGPGTVPRRKGQRRAEEVQAPQPPGQGQDGRLRIGGGHTAG